MSRPAETKQQERIRSGVIGAGANTVAKHLPNLLAVEGVEIASVCNRTRESGERVARTFGIPTLYDRWRVEEDSVDAIRGNGTVTLTRFADGVMYMEFTEAAWRSMATGQAAQLPLTMSGQHSAPIVTTAASG